LGYFLLLFVQSFSEKEYLRFLIENNAAFGEANLKNTKMEFDLPDGTRIDIGDGLKRATTNFLPTLNDYSQVLKK